MKLQENGAFECEKHCLNNAKTTRAIVRYIIPLNDAEF